MDPCSFTRDDWYTRFNTRGSLNLRYFWGSNRVEIRCGEGTVEPHDVKNWIRYLLHFTQRVKTVPLPSSFRWFSLDEGLEFLGLTTGNGSDVQLSSGLTELRDWILTRTACYANFVDFQEKRATAREYKNKLHPNSKFKLE